MSIKFIDGGVCAPKGYTANGIYVGITRKAISNETEEAVKAPTTKSDVGMIKSEVVAKAAAVYTQNKVKGAPIAVTRKNISDGTAQAVICNSRNANTCNADGELKAQMMCDMTAKALGIKASDVIVASTGVIGQTLDVTPIEKNIDKLAAGLSADGSSACENAIMTTDTIAKEVAVEFEIGGKICRMGGIAKGSGMIHPNMATMLCFMTSDVSISAEMLQKAISKVTPDTFNRVSVDGDTSTNDMACIMANGMAGNAEIVSDGKDFEIFSGALFEVMKHLSREIARDGEGATKLLECIVNNAPSKDVADIVSKSVITSNLFKAAMFGADANWGRILCAIGYADAEFDINKIDVVLASQAGKIDVCKDGHGLDFSEEKAAEVLAYDEIQILVDMNSGNAASVAWGCDLTYDYVKINGDYRT